MPPGGRVVVSKKKKEEELVEEKEEIEEIGPRVPPGDRVVVVWPGVPGPLHKINKNP